MKKIILLLISIFYSISSVYALDIVYPKKKVVNINSQATFFVGSANPNMQLKINDIDVKVYENGAFAQYVPLAEGKNVLNIDSQATFFVGSANPNMQLKINDIDVKVYENGAFAQYVPLAEGKNVFNIKSFDDKNSEIMVFEIVRPEIKRWAYSEIKLVDYEAIKQVTVK